MPEQRKLLTVKEASVIAERSDKTVRRWIRQGKLKKYEQGSEGGGSPLVLIDQAELLNLLVSTGQAPVDHPHDQVSDHPHDHPVAPSMEVQELQMRLLKSEAATVQAELQGALNTAQTELELWKTRARESETREQAARSEIQEWKDRHDQLAAELKVLRAQQGLSWWQKLLPG
jgi:hypothetical protein